MESSATARRAASAVLDGTITIVALPSIGAGLHFSGQGLQRVLSAYALTFGGLLLGGRAAGSS